MSVTRILIRSCAVGFRFEAILWLYFTTWKSDNLARSDDGRSVKQIFDALCLIGGSEDPWIRGEVEKSCYSRTGTESKRWKQIYKTWGRKGNVIFIPHPASCQSPLVPSNENFFTRVGWTKYQTRSQSEDSKLIFLGSPQPCLLRASPPYCRFHAL